MKTNDMNAKLPPAISDSPELEVGHKVSPYASPSCKVYFKSGQQFRVPRDLLSKELECIRRSSHEIRLRHIPDEAGHVLIHYLHTGAWQTLRDEDLLDPTNHSTQLEVSLHVYATAQTYKVAGLTELAESKISLYAQGMPALKILLLASDACQLLGEEDSWFSSFTKLRVQELFDDHALLDKTGFLECFETATPYSKMLVKRMFEICCERPMGVYPDESQPAPQDESYTTLGLEAALPLDAAEPESEAPMDSPVVDDLWGLWGVSSKLKRKKKGKKMTEALLEPEPVPEDPVEVESTQIAEPEPVEAMDVALVDDWWPSANTCKKKKKKYLEPEPLPEVLIEEEPVTPRDSEPVDEAEDGMTYDEWMNKGKKDKEEKKKKKKKKKKAESVSFEF